MYPYWILLGLVAFGALVTIRRAPDQIPGKIPLICMMIFIALMIGLRFKVGADWYPYIRMFRLAGYASLDRALGIGDPAYMLVNWLAQQAGLGIWAVNLVAGGLFVWGLYRLVSIQPEPWTALLIAIPYLVIVVAMGFSRQGIAIGILMAGLARFCREGSIKHFFVYAAFAGLFHRTAITVLPLAQLGSSRGRIVSVVLGFVGAALLFSFILRSHVDLLIQSYVVANYTSQGATIRVAMDVIPAVIFFLFRSRMGFNEFENPLWRNFAIAAFIALGALILYPSSAAVDRLAVYLLPLQIVVLSRFSQILHSRAAGRLIAVTFSFSVFYVWLNYADYSFSWIPYRWTLPFA